MELSTSTNLVAFQPGRMRNPMEFCIETCAKGGYRVLDINFCECMNPWSRMRDDDWQDYVQSLGRLAEALGISFRQSHLPYYDIFRERDPVMEILIERSVIGSAMLGVRWAVTHPGTVYSNRADSMDRNLDYYAVHLETARKNGIGICLENDFGYLPGEEKIPLYCSEVSELIELVDFFEDPKHMGICYDFGHANLCADPDHRKNLQAIGARLHALHVQDNHGKTDEHLLPFHGNIDWKTCMQTLAEIDYRGDLTFEAQEFGRYLPKEQKHLAVDYSRKIGQILLKEFDQAKQNTGA